MIRRMLVGGLALCLCGSVLNARPGTVKTRDGQTHTGEVVEKAEGVEVTANGISMVIAPGNVASVEYTSQAIEQDYKDRLAKLPKDAGAPAHLELARWLFQHDALDLAATEAATAVQLDPKNQDAVTMVATVEQQKTLQRYAHTNAAAPAAAAGEAAPVARPAVAKKVLSADQINVIRQMELRPDDGGIRVRYDNDVRRRFLEFASDSENPANFNAVPDIEKVSRIFHKGRPEMRADVKIVNDPMAMAEFRRQVQPILLQGCASPNCHGGTAGGGLVLVNPGDNEAAAYTNFYVLTQYSRAGADKTRMAMIDRTRPQESLLLQYGLPRGSAANGGHPDINGTWTSTFRGKDDPRYQRVLAWISRSLVTVQPDYGIDFSASPTSRPATQPAGK